MSADAVDKQALQEVARAHLPGLHALARRLTGRDPQDLVQDCLLAAYRAFPRLRDRAAAGSARSS